MKNLRSNLFFPEKKDRKESIIVCLPLINSYKKHPLTQSIYRTALFTAHHTCNSCTSFAGHHLLLCLSHPGPRPNIRVEWGFLQKTTKK